MNNSLIHELQDLVGVGSVFSTPEDLAVYSYDGTFAEHCPDVVVLPRSTEQVSRIVQFASRERIPVVTRGMGSGLAAASVPFQGGIALSMTRMSHILEIDQANATVRVEAGTITADLQADVEKLGLFYPPDPSSIKHSTIGGNIACNAGGPRCLKKLRGLPIFTAPLYVFCRTDLMEAAGWTTGTPKNFAEWTTFAKQASKIDPATNSLSQQALVPVDAGSMADWQWWLLVYYSLGGQLYKEDGTPNFDSPEALAATQFLLDMRQATYGEAVNAVGALPTGQGSVIDVDDATQKDNGAVCLAHSGWAAPAFTRPVWEKVTIDPFYGDPANFPNSKPVVLAFKDWLAVADYSPNKELAAEWLKAAFTKEAKDNKWNETMGLIPARNDSQYGYVTESEQLKQEAELASK